MSAGLANKILSWISTLLVIAVVLVAVLLVGCRLVGLQVYTVLSGSMEPNYHVGSIIYVKKVDPGSLQVGDAISFLISENTVATHRIVEVLPDEDDPNVIRFRTKGDANAQVDNALVHCNNLLGKVVGTVPYLGYVSDFVQHPPGTYITIGAMAILILLVFVPDIVSNVLELNAEEEPQAQVTQMDNEKLKAELETLKQKIQQQTKEKLPETNQRNEVNEDEENV